MLISQNADCNGEWQAYASPKIWQLALPNNNLNTLYAKFRDAAGNESACGSNDILHDNIPPQAGTLVIENGAARTTKSSVTLSITASASQMYLTQDPQCLIGGVWEGIANCKLWPLAYDNASNTIYLKLRDEHGNSLCKCEHRACPPFNPSISINQGALKTKNLNVTFSISAAEAESMYLTSCEVGGSWETFSSSETLTLPEANP